MLKPLVRGALSMLGSVLLGLTIAAIAAYVYVIRTGPTPQNWHTVQLAEEFTAADESRINSFADYRALEDRLYAEFERRVRGRVPAEARTRVNRFQPGSLADPQSFPVDWNRSVEWPVEHPRAAVLLLHGLTDAPYSLRALGERLHASGVHVVAWRMPGHGTAPSGLRSFKVEDLQAVVRIAMRDLRARLGPEVPISIIGYSNGAALAVDYALAIQGGADLPRPASLVLISPAIGLTRLAVLARVRTGLSSVPGFGRSAWQVIATELEPFKYSSFPFNAAGETQRLTSMISRRVRALAEAGQLAGFPPTLAFVSTVDSTVRADAVIDSFLRHLSPGGHELVLFDINRYAGAQALLVRDPGPLTARVLAMHARPFALSVLTNVTPDTLRVHALRADAGSDDQHPWPLDLSWPRFVFSLSHVALPFPPDDPVYGFAAEPTPGRIQLGNVEARGENGVLALPSWMLTRLRSNPFYSYLEQRAVDFVVTGASQPAAAAAAAAAAP